ncbi:MAG: DUF5640 domain-containing protein [Chthoniobacterales bacterium]
MKKFFGFGSSTPPPPSPPSKPPTAPAKPTTPAPAAAKSPAPAESSKPAAASSAPGIVGKWREPGSSDTTEFHADGSVTEKTGSGDTIRGRYSIRDKHLKIDLEGVADQLSFPVAIGSDELEMTDTDGKITYYERVS